MRAPFVSCNTYTLSAWWNAKRAKHTCNLIRSTWFRIDRMIWIRIILIRSTRYNNNFMGWIIMQKLTLKIYDLASLSFVAVIFNLYLMKWCFCLLHLFPCLQKSHCFVRYKHINYKINEIKMFLFFSFIYKMVECSFNLPHRRVDDRLCKYDVVRLAVLRAI